MHGAIDFRGQFASFFLGLFSFFFGPTLEEKEGIFILKVFFAFLHLHMQPNGQSGGCYIREFQSNSNVLYLINCGNKSKCFCVFYKFYFSFHNTEYKEVVPVLTNLILICCLMQLILHNINCKAALPTTFTAKAVPNMLSSVLTDVMQMLPSAVNHTHKKQ